MSKYVNLDNLKTFLTQLKTHITDPIINDVSTLSVKVRNAENNIITANSNISSVQQSLNDKINSKTNVQSGEIISTNNDTIGYFKNIKINGNTHYKKSDGTYIDSWESGVSLESVGEKEKDSNGKYPIIIKSSNDTKEDKRTILLDSPLRKVGEVTDVLDLDNSQITRKCKTITIDGSSDENWSIDLPKTDIILFYCKNIITENAPKNYDIHLISDKFSSFSYDNMWENTNEGISVSNNILRINISKSKLETQDGEGLKKWLASNPITIVYELATPTTEDIEVTSNTLTDFATSCTLTIDNTIKGNIECNEVVGLIPSVEKDSTRLANLETDNTTNKSNITNLQNNKFALQVNVKHYINNSELLTYVDTDNTQMQFKKSGLYKITVTKPRGTDNGISFCDTSLDFETRGKVLVGDNMSLYRPKTSSLVMYIDKTKTYEFFGFVTGTYQGATTYTKQRGTEFKTNLQGTDILIELIKEC